MKPLPSTETALVLRTDFSDDDAWRTIRAEITAPVPPFGFLANVEFVDDKEYRDLATEQVVELLAEDNSHSFIIVADRVTMTEPDHPLLVIDLFSDPLRELRAIPSAIQAIENNLSLANMDFEDFADSADEDGIFRDFPH